MSSTERLLRVRLEQAAVHVTPAIGATSVGIDVVEVARLARAVERWGARLLERTFTDDERRYCDGMAHPLCHLAGRLAAKEAVFKALKMRWERSFCWRMIEIGRDGGGGPVVLHIPEFLEDPDAVLGIEVSISHAGGYAVAIATCNRRRAAW